MMFDDMSSPIVSDHDPFNPHEVFSFLKRHAIKLSIGTVACAAISLALSYFIPNEWEATVILQTGQVQPAAPSASPILVEQPARTTERLKAESFVNTLLNRLDLPTQLGASRRADLIRNSLNAQVMRTSDLIKIKLRDFGQHEALLTLQAAQNQLIQAHTALLQPTLDRYKSNHDIISRQLVDAQLRLEQTRKLNNATKGGGSDSSVFSEKVLLADILHQTEAEVGKFQLQLSELNEQMSAARTFNTRVFSDATVSEYPVFPKRSLFLLAGAIMGFVVLFFVALLREMRQR